VSDEQDLDPEVERSASVAEPEGAVEPPAKRRGRKAGGTPDPEGIPAPSEPMDFDEFEESRYLIADSYRAQRVRVRKWVGRDVHPGLFAEEGEWLVTRPDGSKFVLGDKEFRARFTLEERAHG